MLLTGFGPFPRVPVNATSILVPKICEAATKAFPDVRVIGEILPTEWTAGPARAAELYAAHRPLLAIHFGVSHRATGFAIEARGRNHCAATPDASGALPASMCVSAHGPKYLPTGLPAALIVDRLRRRGIAAQLSRDAGSYLCNTLMYRTLELARQNEYPARNGFVHLPETLADPRHPRRGPLASSPLSWTDVIEGGLEIIAASLGRQKYASAQLAPS
jgi:pyroglutamyl-peptidase